MPRNNEVRSADVQAGDVPLPAIFRKGGVIDSPVLLGADGTITHLLPPPVLPRQRSRGAGQAPRSPDTDGVATTDLAPPAALLVYPSAPLAGAAGLASSLDAAGAFDAHPRRLLPRLPRRRTLLLAALVVLPLAAIAVRFRTDVVAKVAAVPAPRWHWLAVCVVASIGFYALHAVALRAASGMRLPLRTVTSVQFAAAAANRVVPAGLGAIAVNMRYLEKCGLGRPVGLAAVASTKAAGALAHAAGIVLVAGTLQDSEVGAAVTSPLRSGLHILGAGPVWGGLAAVTLTVTLLAAHPRVRRKLSPWVRAARTHLRALLHSPWRSTVLLASLTATKVAQVIALAAAVWAFGGSVTLLSVAAVYIVGSAVAGAAPTAGNVGAIEPALAIGLTAAGGGATTMLAAVLVFRMINYWFPVLPGVVALAALRRQGHL